MQIHSAALTFLIIVGIIYAIARQVMPKRISRLNFIILPLFAGFEAFNALPSTMISASAYLELGVSAILAIVFGVWQAKCTRVFVKNGALFSQGGVSYVLAWVLFLASRLVLKFLFEGPTGFHSFTNTEWIIWADIALVWGVRSLTLYILHPEIGHALMSGKTGRNRRRSVLR